MSDAAAPAAAPAAKSPAKPKAAKKPAAKKGPGSGKYQAMIVDAIVSLKDRTGSSVPAIVKFVGGKYSKDLAAGWEKTVAQVLKRFAASGKVVKVKASYKVRGQLVH
jgi:histone H1/5